MVDIAYLKDIPATPRAEKANGNSVDCNYSVRSQNHVANFKTTLTFK